MLFKRIISILAIVAFVGAVEAQAGAHKGPAAGPNLKVGSMFDVEGRFEGGAPPSVTALGPGDSVGFETYDYGTNGGACHNIVVFDDGAVAIGQMGQDETGSDARGTYYTFTDNMGATWSTWHRVESARSGWGNIGQIPEAGGVEVTNSHANNLWNVDAARGAGVWTESNTGSALSIWPRLAVGGNFVLHGIGSCLGGGPLDADMYYTRSMDAGASFDVVDDLRIFTGGQGSNDADGWDIAAEGTNVYVSSTPAWDGTAGVGGGDVLLATSNDNGDTWSQQIVYDVPAEGELPENDEAFMPDGSGQILIDNDGNPHVFWGSYLGVGDATSTPVLFLSVDAPIMHWSAATGVTTVALADADTSIGAPPGRDGNYASQPDAGIDADGNIYVIYQRMVNETDANGNYYEHVFAVASNDGGASWGDPVDVTPGAGFDAGWGSIGTLVDDYIHFTYGCDDTAGNSIQGNHLENQTAVMYHKVDKTTIPFGGVSVGQLDGLPTRYTLDQNYPNPFNPSTRIHYSVPTESFVTLKVYDILGKEVATLVNGEQVAGNYFADFAAADLANGTYFYRLQAGDFSETKKMMLLK